MAVYAFDEFFASDQEETLSPFLKTASKKIARNLKLKTSLFSLFLLIAAFIFSFFNSDISYFFLTGVYFLSGTPALIDSLYDIKEFDINIDVLMTLAAILSVVIGNPIEGGLLLVLFALSGAIEESVTAKTFSALQHLNKLTPTLALVVDAHGQIIKKAVQSVVKDELLLIKAGELVPLDGVVVEGISSVNLSHLTGESLPITKKVDDLVQAGAINCDGILKVRVLKSYHDSTLSQIIQLITRAQESKPRLQKFLDRYGRSYASTIIFLAFTFSVSLPAIFDLPFFGLEGSLYRSLSFLIAASPCALIIATPTAYFSAISACAKKGILLKGGVLLDTLAGCKKIAFDKTGTLTRGQLTLERIDKLSPGWLDQDEALVIAASIEQAAKHPIAEALHQELERRRIPMRSFQSIVTHAGLGVEGIIDREGQPIHVKMGRLSFVTEQSAQLALPRPAKMTAYMSIHEELFAFTFNDEVKPNLDHLMEQLKEQFHLKVAMLTGDHLESAQSIASQLGIEEVYADLHPEDKLAIISDLAAKEKVAMVGDGINDAPSLARAHVGISMGNIGSKSAIDASDVVFLNDDLTNLPWLLAKGKKTQAIVRQNLTLALAVIGCASFMALGGVIPLWLAVILHEGGTIVVGLNSLRLMLDSGK